jgi:TetR/AcrR family transcriptional regulator
MVTTRASTSVDMRTRLVQVATRLFAARGFDATPLQDIADEVGLTKPAVLHHFSSKESLRLAVLQSILDHWRDTLPRLLLAATASEQRFDAVFGEVYRFFATEPDRARVIAREALDRPQEMRRLMRGAVAPVLAAVAGYVETGKTSGRHYADVDAEAYIAIGLQLVIASAAVADVTSASLGEARIARARFDRELSRLAKAALFSPRAPDEKKPKNGKRRRT